MKNIIYLFLFLSGCATLSQDEVYHRLAVKPFINEESINGKNLLTAYNPYGVDIIIEVECEDRDKNYFIPVKANDKTLVVRDDSLFGPPYGKKCSVEKWKIK